MKIHLPVSTCAFRASPIAFCIVFFALPLSSFATGGFPDDDDIGSPAHARSSSYNRGTGAYTVEGGGADIYGTADQFHFLHRGWDGDVRLITRVDSVGATKPWAKAGLMIRDTTAADSRNVDFILSSSHGVQLTHRATTGGSTTSDVVVTGASAPYWLNLPLRSRTRPSDNRIQSAGGRLHPQGLFPRWANCDPTRYHPGRA